MNILVINAGSSSLKWKLLDMPQEQVRSSGIVDSIGQAHCTVKHQGQEQKISCKDHTEAVKIVFEILYGAAIHAIAYRVVHGGLSYQASVRIDQKVLKDIVALSELAPVHNPLAVQCISAAMKTIKDIPHIAIFDTAFHHTMPRVCYQYAVPKKWLDKYGIRKFGFHGISHQYALEQTKIYLGKPDINMISCHLGNGSSVCAISHSQSVDTSMGFTPLSGLIMGQRCGDIDTGAVAYAMKKEKISMDKMIQMLNNESGLSGLCGDSDFRKVYENAAGGDKDCQLALAMFENRLLFYIGGYKALLGNIDAITFTGGIGEGAWYLRESICSRLGIAVKDTKSDPSAEGIISSNEGIQVLVIKANEELMIARDAMGTLN